MSKNKPPKKKVVVTTETKSKETTATVRRKGSASRSTGPKEEMLFGKANYLLMLAGVALLMIGLLLMSGGKMPSADVWDDTLIYSWQRTVLAPLVILIGIALEIVAIFHKPKQMPAA